MNSSKDKIKSIEENELLFGHSNFKNITAIEYDKDSNIIVYYNNDGATCCKKIPFEPFLFMHDDVAINGSSSKPIEIKELKGDGYFKYISHFRDFKSLGGALEHLSTVTGFKPSSDFAPYFHISDPVHQYMLYSGDTNFKGMRFSDLKRLTIDIETDCDDNYNFSNAKRESDRILLIGINFSKKSGEFEYASARDMSEKEMLLWLNNKIREYDPDTIEGHNIFKFDIPYIAERAKMHKVKLSWGRDGSDIKFRKSRIQVAERTLDYNRCDIFGRNVIDTWVLAQFYDVQTRSLESTNLKHLAVHFGVAPKDRQYIETSKIKWYFANSYDEFLKYNKDDIMETVAISEILSYSYFIQAQIFPYSYQNTVVRGNATKINALFLREYLNGGWAVPKNAAAGRTVEFEGGYTDIFETGIIKNVGHCDVRSLYPSIMLAYNVAPASDSKGIFLPMLTTLRDFRIDAKRLMKASRDSHEKLYYDALQGTFKILINSFYGYLGSSIHNFSDNAAAAKVTEIGRATIVKMVEILKKEKCRVIEIDTDGVYFVPPENASQDEEFEKITAKINDELPEGIEVEYDGHYKAMLSFKMKNYALLDYNGELTIKGSALKSRGLEKYLRNFTHEMIFYLLNEKTSEIESAYNKYRDSIETKKMPVDDICKTETLTDSLKLYQAKIKDKKRNPAAQYELALKSGREYQAGDSVSYYVTGTAKKVTAYSSCKMREDFDLKTPDYNVAYYVDKLDSQYKKFREMIETEMNLNIKLGQQSNQGELF